jgi:hypothetical protein
MNQNSPHPEIRYAFVLLHLATGRRISEYPGGLLEMQQDLRDTFAFLEWILAVRRG